MDYQAGGAVITVKQAAALAGVSERRIRRLLEDKTVKSELLTPRMRLVDEASLREWMATPRRAGNPNWKPRETPPLSAGERDTTTETK